MAKAEQTDPNAKTEADNAPAEKAPEGKFTVTLLTEWPLTDPSTDIRYTQGTPVTVDKVSNWLKAQKEAGLFTISE